ncbi:MAG TPA: methyltransferase domain-containing protein [Casimicrobiaceae bacterium]|nr:methyltransferase domain-containing protein [Casimicrobiaceae bacterium]
MAPPDSRHAETTRESAHVRASTQAWPGDPGSTPGPSRAGRERRFAIDETFLAHFLRAPAVVGGVVPSSRVLARTLSRHAQGFESIVELGAGAGSVTRWLAADHPATTLTVIERSPGMARRLQRSWPQARVHAGCVHERAECLRAQPASAVAVSSLPFRSLPDELARPTIDVLQHFLLAHPERRLVQYSYGLREPFVFDVPGLRWRRVERVWRNLPPALVWIAARAAGPR